MSDMSSMSRENKKRQLRRQIISPGDDRKSAYDDEGSGRGHRRRGRVVLIVVIIVLIAALAAFLGLRCYNRNYHFTGYETSWQVPMDEGSLVGYESFGGNVLKYTKDGASYIDNRGRTIWAESYEMKSPAVAVNGDYAAIADMQGNQIYICSLEGRQGEAVTILPISHVAVSQTGTVAAVLEDSISSYVAFFRRDGTTIDITVKTNMSGDGYPLDIALSADGTQLMCSYVYLQSGELKNRVVFYDFSEVGKNVPNRLVGGFDDPFNGTLVPEVTYLSGSASCAFTGNGPVFFSSQNLASPSLVRQIDMDDEDIRSVCHSQNYVGVIAVNKGSEFPDRMDIFKPDGSYVTGFEFNYDYTSVDIDDDYVILYNDSSCRIYNMSGVEKLSADFDFTVSKICKGRFPNSLIVTGPQLMCEIQLK